MTESLEELKELSQLCREGRLYDVECWIRDGRPLQLAPGTKVNRGWFRSALQVAIESRQHALLHLLLANGYQPDQERDSPFDYAMKPLREHLVDLLFHWGADPRKADPEILFGTYSRPLFEWFWSAGLDFTQRHELAKALGHSTSNKPLYGFVRRYRKENPAIQMELNMALGYQVEEENSRGVQLCLWAGADPHAQCPHLRYCDYLPISGENESDTSGPSAIEIAAGQGNVEILQRLGPDPERDDFDELYREAKNGTIVRFLGPLKPPADLTSIIRAQAFYVEDRRFMERNGADAIVALFDCGVRWTEAAAGDLGDIRRNLLRGYDSRLESVLNTLRHPENCAPQIYAELTRTPSMKKRMRGRDRGFACWP